MPPKITNLPDSDHVMRYVPWRKLLRDGDDNVLGFLPEAFELPNEEYLSVNWVEFFPDPATRIRDCIWDLRKSRKTGAKSAFAVGNVGRIKEVCLQSGYKVDSS
jgi:hypothetical protein